MNISVIIPVLREESRINKLISELRAGSGNIEIIVVDGDPSGSTVKAITHEGIVTPASEPGRGRQMNRGAAVASGDILLFLHADTRLPAGAFSLMRAVMKDEGAAAGAFDLGIDSPRFAFRVIERMASLRSRLTNIPYGDQAIFIRKDVFDELGGFKDYPIMEDVELMRDLKRAGRRVCFIPEKVSTSARRWEKEGVLYCTLRNWTLVTLYRLGVSPSALARFYK